MALSIKRAATNQQYWTSPVSTDGTATPSGRSELMTAEWNA